MRSLRHLAWLTVAAAAITATLAAPAAASTGTETHSACLHRVMLATLRQLHTPPTHWHIKPLNNPHLWGGTYPVAPFEVDISPTAPCSMVPSIVHHEWMHTQQFAHPLTYPGRDIEVEADCGSWLLGSDYTPYITLNARRYGTVGCTISVLEVANIYIKRAGVKPVRSIWQ